MRLNWQLNFKDYIAYFFTGDVINFPDVSSSSTFSKVNDEVTHKN